MSISNSIADLVFEKTLEKFSLIGMRNCIFHTNPSRDLPYHSTEHMFGVAKRIVAIWPTEVTSDLLVAALWHDYDHSGGSVTDDINIIRAVGHLQHYVGTRDSKTFSFSKAAELIKCTQFMDGKFTFHPNNTEQRILRDADILYSFSDNSGAIALGLYHELGRSGKLAGYPSKESAQKFMDGQREFLTNLTFFTSEAKAIREAVLEDVLALQAAVFAEEIAKD